MNMNRLREQYVSLFADEGVQSDVLDAIEARLDVQLPADIREIASFYHGGMIGGISHNDFAIAGPANNVVDSTLRLRELIDLPHNLVVVAEPENGLIVLDTESLETAVIWCDAHDAANLGNRQFTSAPGTWASYAEFFTYLLEEEEDER